VRDPEAFRAFLDRDWSAAIRSEERYLRYCKRKYGVAVAFRLADELRQQVRAARPDWPSAEEREEDLATHLRVIDVIRRIPVRAR
jgi:hypothetical protein